MSHQASLRQKEIIQYEFNRIFQEQNSEASLNFPQVAKLLIEKNNKKIFEKINKFISKQSYQKNEFEDLKIEFTRQEVFTVLLMMYLNAFEKQNNCDNRSGFNQINMERIKQSNTIQAQQKLKCIHQYFVNFYEQVLNDEIKLESIQTKIQQLEYEREELDKRIKQLKDCQNDIRNSMNQKKIKEDEIIEFIRRVDQREFDYKFTGDSCQMYLNQGKCEDFQNSILVNFADKNVGGLSLDDKNIAQEEILMLTHPEAIISMLFMKPMAKDEAVLIKNVIRFNDYIGYESTFRYKAEKYFDSQIIENNKEPIKNDILCMDALYYSDWISQFEDKFIKRELKKSYIAFSLAIDQSEKESISTGKWGCGIFNGDSELKFLIQWLTFSKALQKNLQKNKEIQDNFNNQQNLNQNTQEFLKGMQKQDYQQQSRIHQQYSENQNRRDQNTQNQLQLDQQQSDNQNNRFLYFSTFGDEGCERLIRRYLNKREQLENINQFIINLQKDCKNMKY
ncbi:unnamed protein product [Paramecium sonneborni]|uniref:poly(ADP-ribose) glycohydrolase n=1 Tax=Paramecium sonneborni TaxID=65129 RepID=A0A8S1RL28_9CILI|nr:unnamed protein product [Paramecium sonneborni]